MSNNYVRAALPHLGAIVVFLVLSAAYYSPALQGRVLNQSDNIQARGMQSELIEVRDKAGKMPLWTNAMFGGMPAYQILMETNGNVLKFLNRVFLLNQSMTSPLAATFLLMTMFYILMLALGVDWRLSAIGAIAYGLSTNHILLNEAGHSTKVITLAYLPPTIGAIFLTFRGKLLLGGSLTAVFLSLQLSANHIQITYYSFILLALLGIVEVVRAAQNKGWLQLAKATGVLILAAALALGTNLSRLWTTYEYSAETIRGKSELTQPGAYSSNSSQNSGGEGLSKDYAFAWSYGVGETFTVLIPNYMGGSSSESLAYDGNFKDNKTGKAMQRVIGQLQQQDPQKANEIAGQLVGAATPYWGDQPFTSGPVYYGAVICFLFVLGLLTVKDPIKWWFLGGSLVVFMLSWGRNFSALNYFLFDHFPMYNKFRAVSMILGIGHIFFIALAGMAVQAFMSSDLAKAEKIKALYTAGGAISGLGVLLLVASATGLIGFSRPEDMTAMKDYPELLSAIRADRAALMRQDVLRTLVFVGLALGAMWAFAQERVQAALMIGALGVLTLVDFWSVGTRFVDKDAFVAANKKQELVAARPIDQQIKADTDPHFRVLDLSRGQNPYASATPSYFFKSLGGYHAAKLSLFQDLCEHYLFNFNPTANDRITGMLNVKYFILQNPQTGQPFQLANTRAMGNAWLVDTVRMVANGDEEIKALASFEPDQEAIVQQKYAPYLQGLKHEKTAGDYIKLTSYHPDNMVYEVNLAKERLAMFSEIYYPAEKGWNIYLDGKKYDKSYIKANYAIRAARLPAGKYSLAMKFEPQSYIVGERVSLVASLVILAVFGFALYLNLKAYTPPPPPEKPAKTEKLTVQTQQPRARNTAKKTPPHPKTGRKGK